MTIEYLMRFKIVWINEVKSPGNIAPSINDFSSSNASPQNNFEMRSKLRFKIVVEDEFFKRKIEWKTTEDRNGNDYTDRSLYHSGYSIN